MTAGSITTASPIGLRAIGTAPKDARKRFISRKCRYPARLGHPAPVWSGLLSLQVTPGRRLEAAALVLAIAAALMACTPPGTTESTGLRETALTGQLSGEPRGDAGCAWVETAPGERVEVVYPNGWRVEFEPVAVFDEQGRQVAAEGDTLRVEGYFNDVGASLCTAARSFVATRVMAGQ